MSSDKQDDKQVLEKLNIDIGNAESKGDLKWLTDVIAPEFAFHRASGKIDGGVGFLNASLKWVTGSFTIYTCLSG